MSLDPDLSYDEWVAVQAMDDAMDRAEGADRANEQLGQYADKVERRLRAQLVLRRFMERRIHNLKLETRRLRRAHRRERERAEQAISFLRVYRQQPGMDWPDVAAFLDADGPF